MFYEYTDSQYKINLRHKLFHFRNFGFSITQTLRDEISFAITYYLFLHLYLFMFKWAG